MSDHTPTSTAANFRSLGLCPWVPTESSAIWRVAWIAASFLLVRTYLGAEAPTEQLKIKEFGVKTGKPIMTGFVFVDGRYLPTPYRTTRKGVAVFINDSLISRPYPWPPRDVAVDKEPGQPAGLTESSTFDDIECKDDPYESHWHKQYRYVMQHFSGDVAVDKMAEWFRRLPFVKSVERKPRSHTLTVRTRKGAVMRYSITRPPDPGYGILRTMTRQDLLRELEVIRRRFENRLAKGDCFFLFKGVELSFGSRKTAEALPQIVELLTSSKPDPEKLKGLYRLGLLPRESAEHVRKALLTNFEPLPELLSRVQKLKKDRGAKRDVEEPESAEEERMLMEEALKREKRNREDRKR